MRLVRATGKVSAATEMRYWLFYAGPENYLSDQGESDFGGVEWVWSSAPEVTAGDLVLLYRTSLSKLRPDEMVQLTGMPIEKARELKREKIGSDIPALWQVASGNQGPFGKWQASCAVRQVAKIDPPIKLSELKLQAGLRKWQDLRWNFQAQGRDAIEVPGFAWAIIREIISGRLDRPFAISPS